MATNRATARRRSARIAFDEDDAPTVKRAKTEANGTAKKAAGATRKSVKPAYDENDDGFQFTRRTSKRVSKVQSAPEPIPEQPSKSAPARRKKSLAPPAPQVEESGSQRRRRSARLSGDHEEQVDQVQVDGSAERAKAAPKKTKKAAPVEKERKKQVSQAPEVRPEQKQAHANAQTPKHEGYHTSKKRDGEATKIKLPFADTPVINRNKEMRKASKDPRRRSSTGLRGRRASSLIDSGMSNALPHTEVEIRDFYRYIEQNLPEPRRMKQLLTWCGSRALPDKPSGTVKNANAIMAARAIQQEMIDDIASKPELSDWFSREETTPPPAILKPNPQNEMNKAKLQELKEEVERLEQEKTAWESLLASSKNSPPPTATPEDATTHQPPPLTSIDASLLDPAQAAILATLQSHSQPPPQPYASSDPANSTTPFPFTFTTPTALTAHLSSLSLALEPHIDVLADGLHKIDQFRGTAERCADRVLGTASRRLEKRERAGREKVGSVGIGVGDVLRGLAGVLNE